MYKYREYESKSINQTETSETTTPELLAIKAVTRGERRRMAKKIIKVEGNIDLTVKIGEKFNSEMKCAVGYHINIYLL